MGRTNRLPRRATTAEWFGARPSARWMIEAAAGRPWIPPDLTPDDLTLANRHGLLALLGSASRVSSPDVSAGHARGRARQAVMRNHLRVVLERFATAGIRAAVVKGPYVAAEHYVTPSHRTFTDIDLLVPREDLDRSTALLGELAPIGRSIPEKRPTTDKRDVPVYDLEHGVSFNVDLHWDLFSYTQLRGHAAGATQEAWIDAAWDPEHTLGPLWKLPIAAELAFLCAHAWLDHRFRLILFRDILEVTEQAEVDWDVLVEYASRWSLRSVCYPPLLIASRLLGAAVPPDTLERLRVPCAQTRAIEAMLPSIDFVRFDGHRPHPLNLAVVTMHDDAAERRRMLWAAPFSFVGWRRRVLEHRSETAAHGRPRSLLIVLGEGMDSAGGGPFRLTAELAALGWDVDVVSAPADRGSELVQRLDGERTLFAIRRHLTRFRPDVVLAIGPQPLVAVRRALEHHRDRPMLVYESDRGFGELDEGSEPGLGEALARADVILAPSPEARDRLVSGLGIAPGRVHVAVETSPAQEPGAPFQGASSRWHDVIMKGLLEARHVAEGSV